VAVQLNELLELYSTTGQMLKTEFAFQQLIFAYLAERKEMWSL